MRNSITKSLGIVNKRTVLKTKTRSQLADEQLIDNEYEEKAEVRRLKHWTFKVLLLTFVFITVSIMLAFCYSILFNEKIFQHEIVSIFTSFTDAMVEITKFLFTN